MNDDNNPAANITVKKRKGKSRTLLAVTVAVILIVSSATILLYPYIRQKLGSSKKPDNLPMYSDKLVSYNFYPSIYDLDITTVPEYMDLDRYLYYTIGGNTIAVTDGNYQAYGNAVAFFGEYFETVIAGDVEKYNTFFTNRYYETADPYELFAPQMLYDINVEQLSRTVSDTDNSITYAFNVSYKIYRNDGTFRNDIPSDASKTLYFELIENDGDIKIDRITYRVAVVK